MYFSLTAFLNGAATGAQCLTRLGKTGARFVVASGIEEAKALLTNGTVRCERKRQIAIITQRTFYDGKRDTND